MQDYIDKQRQICGTVAVFLWVICGIYLFASMPGVSFISWQAAVYFLPCLFAVNMLFGMATVIVQVGIATGINKIIKQPTIALAKLYKTIGLLLFFAEAVAIYFLAGWFIALIF